MKRLGWIKITLIILMVIGFLVRVYQIGSASNQFHLTRQFSTAQMVRGDYFATADVPEWRRAIVAAEITNLVMIYTIFTIFLLFGWFSIQRHGLRRVLLEPDTWLFMCFSLLPAGLYYFNGLFTRVFVQRKSSKYFLPIVPYA